MRVVTWEHLDLSKEINTHTHVTTYKLTHTHACNVVLGVSFGCKQAQINVFLCHTSVQSELWSLRSVPIHKYTHTRKRKHTRVKNQVLWHPRFVLGSVLQCRAVCCTVVQSVAKWFAAFLATIRRHTQMEGFFWKKSHVKRHRHRQTENHDQIKR